MVGAAVQLGRARALGLSFRPFARPPARGRPPPPARSKPPHAHGTHLVYLLTPPRQEFDEAIDAKVSDHRNVWGGEPRG